MMKNALALVILFVCLGVSGVAPADQNSASLDALFQQLASAEDAESGYEIERKIWKIWGLPKDRSASVPFAQGVVSMSRGELEAARRSFDRVVVIAPEFAEGWNKRATVAFMLGDMKSSVIDIQRTLALEPRHFGALSGLALIYDDFGWEEKALDVLIEVKELHPMMIGIDERMQMLRKAIAERKT